MQIELSYHSRVREFSLLSFLCPNGMYRVRFNIDLRMCGRRFLFVYVGNTYTANEFMDQAATACSTDNLRLGNSIFVLKNGDKFMFNRILLLILRLRSLSELTAIPYVFMVSLLMLSRENGGPVVMFAF